MSRLASDLRNAFKETLQSYLSIQTGFAKEALEKLAQDYEWGLQLRQAGETEKSDRILADLSAQLQIFLAQRVFDTRDATEEIVLKVLGILIKFGVAAV